VMTVGGGLENAKWRGMRTMRQSAIENRDCWEASQTLILSESEIRSRLVMRWIERRCVGLERLAVLLPHVCEGQEEVLPTR